MKRELANLGRLKALELIETTKIGTGGICTNCLIEVSMLHDDHNDPICRRCMMDDHIEWEWRIASTIEFIFDPGRAPEDTSRVYRAVMPAYWATMKAGK